jgi:hypothetical protein
MINMTEATFTLDGQALAKICKQTLPDAENQGLLSKLTQLNPDYPLHLARLGEEWYRLGGIVDVSGKRIANDLIEWTERTFKECGQNLHTFIDYALEQNLIATRITGNTLYLVVPTGRKAEDFIQIEIDKTQEISDRFLVDEQNPPEDLEEFIDPLSPKPIQAFAIGTARYQYRRKTDVAIFMAEMSQHPFAEHPAQRFMEDFNRSSAGEVATFCHDWIIRPFRHTGRFGEQIIDVDIISTQKKNIPYLETLTPKGHALQTQLNRFDRQAGYPFAWFFYMLKGLWVPTQLGVAVFKDIAKDFSYLPERDVAVLKDWIDTPYSV